MIALSKWTAKRVSDSITIEGVDAETGRPVKVTGVGLIQSGDPSPIAIGRIKGLAGEQSITLQP